MTTSRFTHTSILATDLEESTAFYEDILGMERVPAPNFPEVDVVWLRCGDRTLHLFDRDIEPADYYQIGLHVDDFERVYDAAEELDLVTDFDRGEDLPTVYELPEGSVQMYIHDPAGNLVEINYHDVDALPEYIQSEVVARADQVPQTGTAAEARLYFDEFLEDIGATQPSTR
ncbi:MAG: VOC family protein [Halobacteriota archaeon]